MLKKELLEKDSREGREGVFIKNSRKAIRMRNGMFKALMGNNIPEPEEPQGPPGDFVETVIVDETSA